MTDRFVWQKRTLAGRPYWFATRSGIMVPGIRMIHASRNRPGAFYLGLLDVDQYATLADAKRAAVREVDHD